MDCGKTTKWILLQINDNDYDAIANSRVSCINSCPHIYICIKNTIYAMGTYFLNLIHLPAKHCIITAPRQVWYVLPSQMDNSQMGSSLGGTTFRLESMPTVRLKIPHIVVLRLWHKLHTTNCSFISDVCSGESVCRELFRVLPFIREDLPVVFVVTNERTTTHQTLTITSMS